MKQVFAAMANAIAMIVSNAASGAGATNGSAVDVRAYDGELAFILNAAATGGADHTLDVKIQTSADGSTGWTDITGAAFTQVTNAAASHQKLAVQSRDTLGYVRAVGTLAGTTPTCNYGVSLVGPAKYPA